MSCLTAAFARARRTAVDGRSSAFARRRESSPICENESVQYVDFSTLTSVTVRFAKSTITRLPPGRTETSVEPPYVSTTACAWNVSPPGSVWTSWCSTENAAGKRTPPGASAA